MADVMFIIGAIVFSLGITMVWFPTIVYLGGHGAPGDEEVSIVWISFGLFLILIVAKEGGFI